MITEIQGLPPIVIQDFPELQNNVKKEIQDTLYQQMESTEQVSKSKSKNFEKQKIADFSGLSEKAMQVIKDSDVSVEFSLDQDTKKMIMKLINSETKEVIHQYPHDIALKIARIVANTLETGNVTNAKF
jgi:uncharacterized FlaG/YvyC family protein